MRTRYAASILVAALVGVSATGCAFITPQATTTIGQVTDGVDGNVTPDLAIRNATLISDNDTSASLIVSLVNTGDEDHQVVVQYEDSSGKSVDAVALVGARSTLTVGGDTDERLVFTNVKLTVGQLFPVFFQYGTETGTKLLVPVLSSDWQQFEGLQPTPTPTATVKPIPVPTSTSTLEPQATVTPEPTASPEATLGPTATPEG